MPKYQIVIVMKNKAVLFNTADTNGGVDLLVDEFAINSEMRSINVYRYSEETATYRQAYHEERDVYNRPVGFGRW